MGRFKMKGFFAWLLWCVAHIYYLIGFRNRFVVAISWLWNYITFQRATRLITGMSGASMEALPMPEDEKEILRRAPDATAAHARHRSLRQRSAMISVNTMPTIA